MGYFKLGLMALWLLPAAARAAQKKMKPNHLVNEKSPYLLQHAYNPVDWHPWGEQAFAKARKENKPILLSIGYSTCHWCHVMERESFSDEKIAALMNKHLVAIKLDREERPDIDKVYMTAVQAMTGQGGWPLNVFLTPDLKPFFGGTYFPPEARWGQPGWPALVERIGGLWQTRRTEIDADASRMASALKGYAASEAEHTDIDPKWLDRAFEGYKGSFDSSRGGFGGAPKFPMPVNHNFLLRYYARTGNKEALDMVLKTLREMAAGGIFDQAGGGFHRYSTDADWLLPHFEKMLYDNAQLAVNYLEAYQASRDPELARVARETLGYILRDMTHPEGGFYSAEDADSLPPELAAKGIKDEGHANKAEGAFYLWTDKELLDILGKDAEAFKHHHGVEPGGNLLNDPHGEFKGKNILYRSRPLESSAAKFGLKPEELRRRLEAAKRKLLEVRSNRPRPGLDDKILTSWNGLAISAFAKGYQVLGDKEYLDAAQNCARFLRTHLYEPKALRLNHRWRAGQSAVPGLADDYAFLVQGLIDLYEASYDPQWLRWAIRLTEKQNELFLDKDGGLYMTAEGHDKNLIVRVLEDADNVEPSASSVAALNLLRLEQFTHRKDFREAAEKTLRRFGSRMRDRGLSLPQMLLAADFLLSKPKQVVIAGDRHSPGAREMIKELHSRFIPNKISLFIDDTTRPVLSQYMPFIEGMAPIGGKPTAYVCVNYACELPTNDLKVFANLLDGGKPDR